MYPCRLWPAYLRPGAHRPGVRRRVCAAVPGTEHPLSVWYHGAGPVPGPGADRHRPGDGPRADPGAGRHSGHGLPGAPPWCAEYPRHPPGGHLFRRCGPASGECGGPHARPGCGDPGQRRYRPHHGSPHDAGGRPCPRRGGGHALFRRPEAEHRPVSGGLRYPPVPLHHRGGYPRTGAAGGGDAGAGGRQPPPHPRHGAAHPL